MRRALPSSGCTVSVTVSPAVASGSSTATVPPSAGMTVTLSLR